MTESADILHHCPNEKATIEVFVGESELKKVPAVQFVDGEEWCLWSTYDDGSWIPIDYCPYCGLKLAGTEK